MKYVCNPCGKIFQADDITIHYVTGNKGLEIVAICTSCLEKYLGKINKATAQNEDDVERKKMKMKW